MISNEGGYIVKYDGNGNVFWANSYEVSFSSICTDNESNVYVTGNVDGIIWGSDTIYPIGGDASIFTGKLDSSGHPIWGMVAGGMYYDPGAAIATDIYKNVYVAANFTSPVLIFGTDSIFQNRSNFGEDIVILKYDSSGLEKWVRTPGGNYEDQANAITTDAFGNIFLVGRFDSDTLISEPIQLLILMDTGIYLLLSMIHLEILYGKKQLVVSVTPYH